MELTTLLKRLSRVVGMIIVGEDVADIGADHAQLSLFIVENQLVRRVVIGELGDGPFHRAQEAVAASERADLIEVRQGDGLQVLNEGEVSTVVIAGMGGDTICDIMRHDRRKAESMKRFVFQPMSKYGSLRSLLLHWGWIILEEDVVYENEHFYLLLSAQPSNAVYSLTDLEMEIGVGILCADTETKRRFLKYYLKKYRKMYKGLRESKSAEKQQEADALHQQIKELEGILHADQG